MHPTRRARESCTARCRDRARPDEVNGALADLDDTGTIAQLAQASGLTYLAPREPVILGDVWQQVLNK